MFMNWISGTRQAMSFTDRQQYLKYREDRKVSRIEYDESRHILYALDATETLYAYDLNGKLP